MKSSLLRTIALGALILSALNCDSTQTAPGAGPAFSSISPALTASDLWLTFSFKPAYSSSSSGERNCTDILNPDGTGTVQIEISEAGNTETNTFAYKDCALVVPLYPSEEEMTLVMNGHARREFVWTDKESQKFESYSFEQHISYEGTLGFAADCDYSIDTRGYTGRCTYEDSAGQELTLLGEEMLEAVQEAIANGEGPS